MENGIQQRAELKGVYRFRVLRNGVLISDDVVENKIVKVYRKAIIDHLTSLSPSRSLIGTYIAVGTGNTAVVDADTTLATEHYRKQVTSRTNDGGDIGAFAVTFNAAEIDASSITIEEVGLFGDDASATADSGLLISRVLFNKTLLPIDALFIDWRFTCSDA